MSRHKDLEGANIQIVKYSIVNQCDKNSYLFVLANAMLIWFLILLCLLAKMLFDYRCGGPLDSALTSQLCSVASQGHYEYTVIFIVQE